MENILINFVADPAGLQPGIDGLVEMAAVDQELATQVKKTTSEFQKQNKVVTDGSQQATSSIDKLASGFKNLDKSIAGGAYTKALKSLQKELDGTSDEFKQLQLAIAFAKKQMDSLDPNSEDWKQLNEQVGAGVQLLEAFGKETEKAEGKTQSMKARLRELKVELQLLEDQGADNTAEFQAMAIEAAKLEDQIGDTNARIAALASDTANIDAAIQGVQTLASGFQIAAGAAALFGDENEDMQKVLVKLNAIMAITNGLREVQQALQAQSIFRLKVEQVATNLTAGAYRAMGISVVATSNSFKALRSAIITTGVGALVVGLGYLVSKLTETSSSAEAAEKKMEALNDEFKATEDRLNRVGAALDHVNELNKIDIDIEDVGLKGAQTDVKKLEQDIITTMEKLNGPITGNAFVGLREELAKVQKQLDDADTKNLLDPTKDSKETLDKVKEHYDKLFKQVTDAEKFISVSSKQIDLLRAQDHQKSLDDEQKRQEDAAKKRKDAAEKNREETLRDLKAEFELLKIAKQKEIDLLNAKGSTEGFDTAARASAFQQALVLEEEILLAQRELQLNNEKLTGKERELIKQQTADALIAVETDYGNRIKNIRTHDAEELRAAQQQADEALLNDAIKLKKDLEKAFSTDIQDNDTDAEKRLQKELELYKRGVINREEYEKRKSKITKDQQKKDLEDEIKYQGDLLLIADVTGDQRAEIEKRLYELKKQLRAQDREQEESDFDEAAALRLKKLELAQQSALALAQIGFGIAQKGYQKEEERIKELYDLKKISETEYQNQLKDVKRKQARDEKALAVFQVLVNQGPMAVKAFAQGGFPAVAAAFGLFFGLLAATTKTDVPQFKKGKVRIKGPGTQTSDSIHARISKDESVINAAATIKHEEVLKAINEDRYGAYLVQHELPKYYQNMTLPTVADQQTTTAAEPFNYERMAKAFAEEIANNPTTHVSIDENGLQVWTQEQQSITAYKNKKLTL